MSSFKKIRILSRKSDLAVIQAKEVGHYLLKKYSDLKVEYITKSTIGDKDLKTPLYKMPESGVFTDDCHGSSASQKERICRLDNSKDHSFTQRPPVRRGSPSISFRRSRKYESLWSFYG